VMSCPSNTIVPAVGCNNPEIAFNVVVLPAPFAPIKAPSWPLPTVSDPPLSAVTWPQQQTTSRSPSTPLSFSQVSSSDLWIYLDRRRRAFRDDTAVVENDDAVRHTHDHRHVVLHQKDGHARGANGFDQRHDLRALARVHAGHRLVQQQHRGLRGKRQSYPEQALLAVRKRARNFRHAPLEADHTQDLARLLRKLAFRGLLARQRQQRIPQARPSPAVQSDQHVFEYGVVRKYARALERPDQPKACDFVWLEAVQQGVAVANFASRGF